VLPDGDVSQLPLRDRRAALEAALPVDVRGHFARLAPLATCVGLSADAARKRIEAAVRVAEANAAAAAGALAVAKAAAAAAAAAPPAQKAKRAAARRA
jgi:hypothetical protein